MLKFYYCNLEFLTYVNKQYLTFRVLELHNFLKPRVKPTLLIKTLSI